MKVWRTVALAVAAALVGALITVAVLRGGAGAKKDPDDAPPAAAADEKPATKVETVNGETVVTLDAETAARSHIALTALQPAQRSESATSYATVVDVRDLVDARNQLGVARAQADQARARIAAAEAEYARLKTLHDDNRNISDRVLQEAAANLTVERANAAAAEATTRAASSGVEQRWGSAIARAFAANAPWIDDLIANRRVLVQVVSASLPPQSIRITGGDATVEATYISPASRSDPHIQGRSWFYLAPAGAIVPGMSLTAMLGGGPGQAGAIVPRDAVVWNAGRAWAYVERAPNQFARRAIDASVPMNDGYFVTNLQAGQRVVTTGAQQLLSEENKPKVEE
jgi:hypothetical protein